MKQPSTHINLYPISLSKLKEVEYVHEQKYMMISIMHKGK